MRILVLSDIHGDTTSTMNALTDQPTADIILFLGDGIGAIETLEQMYPQKTFYCVAGNCDFASIEPTTRILELCGKRILMTHGHEWGVKGGLGALIAHAAEVGADIVLFGHTHKPILKTLPVGEVVGEITLSRPMYLFNPGSIGYDGNFGTLIVKGDIVLLSHGKL